MRPRVDVDAGLGARAAASVPGSALTIVGSPRNGRRCGDVGELARELAEGEVLGALADQAEGGDVPERRRAAVAEDDLVALGQGEEVAQALADLADEVLDRRLAVRGAEHRAAEGGEVVELLGAHLGGAGAEPSVGGQQLGRDGDGRGHGWRFGHGFTLGVRPRYEQVADVLRADDAVVTAAIEPQLPTPWTPVIVAWTSHAGPRAG